MDKTEKLLTTAYQSARTGADGINAILPRAQDKRLHDVLVKQMSGYDNLADQASSQLFERGNEVKERNAFSKGFTEVMSKMNAAMDSSTSHLAELMMNGANMGIIEMTKAQNDAPDAEPAAYKLSNDIINFSKQVLEEMKPFL